jgi:hypothetical protein
MILKYAFLHLGLDSILCDMPFSKGSNINFPILNYDEMFRLVCSLSLHTIIKGKCESYKKIMTSFWSSPRAIISNCTNQPSRWLIHVPLVIMFPPCLIATNATRQTQGCIILVTIFFEINMWRILHNPSYGHMPWKFQMECGGPHRDYEGDLNGFAFLFFTKNISKDL